MAYITTIADVHKNRPFKPLYARTQATAQAVTIIDADASAIAPGMVLMREGAGTDGTGAVAIFKAATGTVPCGICGTFAKELEITGTKDVAMWVLGNDAVFKVATGAFDSTAAWTTAATTLATGKPVYLTGNASGLLTIEGSSPVEAQRVARLVSVESDGIVIAGL